MKKNKISMLAVVLLFMSFIFIFVGVSYSIFSYFGNGLTNNVIETGRIVFSYSDADGGGNGIYIENAVPISDEVGKVLSGTGEYFDFSVTANTTTSDLVYEIVVVNSTTSTLSEEYVKIYLTTVSGTTESPTDLTGSTDIVTYNELEDTTNPLLSGKTIYYGTVKAGEVSYGKNFRLRMWVSVPASENFDYSLINDRNFSIKVNVAATSAN